MKRPLILLVALVACSSPAELSTHPSSRPTPTLRPTATATPTPTTSATPEPRSTPTPDLRWRATSSAPSTTIVNHGGRIEVRRADGRLIRTLADESQTGKLSFSFALTPDRRSLYFVRYSTENCSDIVSIPVAGGSIRTIARGSSLSISPDGTRLAYADSFNCGRLRSQAVVRDLATGAERVWIDQRGLGGGVTWMPDGRFLDFAECGADSCRPRLIDTRTMQPVDREAYSLPAYIDHSNVFLGSAVLRGNSGRVVLHVAYSSEGGTEPHPILEYDTKTRITRSLFERSKGAGVLDFDASGGHMLYKTRDRRLFHYDGRRARLIATGITAAVW